MKIFCIGRNYRDHAAEMGGSVPDEPMVFMKPSTAILKNGADFYYPEFSKNIHYELELVLKICKNGKYIEEKFANNYFEEIGLGIDFTARDLQKKCKQKGHPWEIAKAFDHSACIGNFILKEKLDLNNLDFYLLHNEQKVQQGHSGDLVFSFPKLISHISQYFTLNKGDLIFTGTPAGVGPVKIGDQLEGYLQDQLLLNCSIK